MQQIVKNAQLQHHVCTRKMNRTIFFIFQNSVYHLAVPLFTKEETNSSYVHKFQSLLKFRSILSLTIAFKWLALFLSKPNSIFVAFVFWISKIRECFRIWFRSIKNLKPENDDKTIDFETKSIYFSCWRTQWTQIRLIICSKKERFDSTRLDSIQNMSFGSRHFFQCWFRFWTWKFRAVGFGLPLSFNMIMIKQKMNLHNTDLKPFWHMNTINSRWKSIMLIIQQFWNHGNRYIRYVYQWNKIK